MITVIHGDDTGASRTYLYELKARIDTAVILEGDKITVTDLLQELEGGGLFAEKRTLIIEQLLTKKKTGREKEALINFIQEKTLEHDIILWEGKDLDKKMMTLFRHSTLKQFKIPQTLFLFLDSIKPGNGPILVQLFHKVLLTSEPEMVFFMLVRQARLLLALREKSISQIDEVRRMAPWQMGKLQKQAQLFSPQQLITFYTKLADIDQGYKTGKLPLPLNMSLDILLLEI